MSVHEVGIVGISFLLTVSAYGANPFLDAKDDKPVSANFRGTEWSDDFPEHEIPLTARVITTRVAKMPWGAIFKIEFVDLKSRAPQPRLESLRDVESLNRYIVEAADCIAALTLQRFNASTF